jgi:hypothetical protein
MIHSRFYAKDVVVVVLVMIIGAFLGVLIVLKLLK